MPRVATLSLSATSGTGTIIVGAGQGAYFKANDVCRIVTTGEAFSVSVIATGSACDIVTPATRGIGGTGTASSASGCDVVILGNASLEGATLPTRKKTHKTAAYNYAQIVRSSYGFTNTLAASKLYGGPEPNLERQKKAVEHKRQIESILFFGPRSLQTGGTNPQGFCGGAHEFISTNAHSVAGQRTKAQFDADLDGLFAHGNAGSKVAFAAPLPARIISTYTSVGLGSSWGTDYLTGASAKWGVHVNTVYSGAYGFDLPIIVKREWNDMSATTGGYGSNFYALDLSYLWLRPLRDTVLLTNRQANDADTVDEEYLSEFSLEFQTEKAHMSEIGWTS